jgi:hypothetical protein
VEVADRTRTKFPLRFHARQRNHREFFCAQSTAVRSCHIGPLSKSETVVYSPGAVAVGDNTDALFTNTNTKHPSHDGMACLVVCSRKLSCFAASAHLESVAIESAKWKA